MTEAEKVYAVTDRIAPDTADYDVLAGMVATAGELILNEMYPFGYAEDKVVPARYEQRQIQLAIELYNKRGAEGQISHSENGIVRNWPEVSELLKGITPMCGSVISNA